MTEQPPADGRRADGALSVMTDAAARALQAELAIEAAGIGSFDYDLVTGRLVWDDRLIELFGYRQEGFAGTIEAFFARLHPEDVERTAAALQTTIDERGDLDVEYRIVVPGGDTRWVQGRGRVLVDDEGRPVRLLGAAYDTTRQRHGDARVARVLETMSAAFYSLDREWRFAYVNAEAERLLGRSRDELLGGIVWDLFPDAVGSAFEEHYRAAVDSRRVHRLRGVLPRAPGRLVRASRLSRAGRALGLLRRDHRTAHRAGARAAWCRAALADRRHQHAAVRRPGRRWPGGGGARAGRRNRRPPTRRLGGRHARRCRGRSDARRRHVAPGPRHARHRRPVRPLAAAGGAARRPHLAGPRVRRADGRPGRAGRRRRPAPPGRGARHVPRAGAAVGGRPGAQRPRPDAGCDQHLPLGGPAGLRRRGRHDGHRGGRTRGPGRRQRPARPTSSAASPRACSAAC